MRPLALAYHAIGTRAVREDPHGLFVSWARLRRHVAWLQGRGLLAGDVRRAGRARGGRAVRADVRRRVRELLGAGGPRRSGDAVRRRRAGSAAGIRMRPTRRCSPRTACGGCTRRGSRSGRTPRPTPTSRRSASTPRATSSTSARLTLESLLDAPVTSAAYPYGRATAETVRACGRGGLQRRLPDERVRLALDARSTTRARTWTARRRCTGLRLKAAGRYEPLLAHRARAGVRRARAAGRGAR